MGTPTAQAPARGRSPRVQACPEDSHRFSLGLCKGGPGGVRGFPTQKFKLFAECFSLHFIFIILRVAYWFAKQILQIVPCPPKNNCQLFYQETSPPRGACAVGPGSEVDWLCAGVYSQFQNPADTVIQGRSSPLYIVTQYLPITYSPRIL